MKIGLNDYAGHPFQAQLARALAERGHEVTFLYCSTNITPHGDLEATRPGLEVVGVSTGETFEKYVLRKRVMQEIRYGFSSAREQRARGCEVVLTSNVPVIALLVMRLLAPRTRHVLWLQDIQAGLASLALTGSKKFLATFFGKLEALTIKLADAIVVIAPSMADYLADEGFDTSSAVVIENWAPIEEMPERPQDNAWARRHGLSDKFVFLYSGTMGLKHKPELLVELCNEFADDDDVVVVAVCQGTGADWLAEEKAAKGLPNLMLLPYQPFEDLPDVLGSSDVLIAVLEPEAGSFSIPSKVLSYLCSARAVLAHLPAENSSFDLIANRANSGLASSCGDDFVAHARELRDCHRQREAFGRNGRQYAEKTFDIDAISQQFESILRDD